jgi:hypothetical protein
VKSTSTTLEVDRDAREIFNTAAIAIGTNDTEAALDVCRKLVGLEAHYRLALRVDDDAPPEYRARETSRPPAAQNPLRRMDAKFPGRCGRCQSHIAVGMAIAYDAAAKRAYHERCA